MQTSTSIITTENIQKNDNNIDQEIQNQLDTYAKFIDLNIIYEPVNFQNFLKSAENFKISVVLDEDAGIFRFPIRGFRIMLVESLGDVANGIQALQQEGTDEMIQVHFEWKFDQKFENNYPQMSLVSVGYEKFCVLFRASKWGFEIPQVLLDYLCSSNKKILVQNCFKKFLLKTQELLSDENLIDYTTLMLSLGYENPNFSENFGNMKSNLKNFKNLNINWEANKLTYKQICIAALNIFVPNIIIRRIKYLYDNNYNCAKCETKMGKIKTYNSINVDFCNLCCRGSQPAKKLSQKKKEKQLQKIKDYTKTYKQFSDLNLIYQPVNFQKVLTYLEDETIKKSEFYFIFQLPEKYKIILVENLNAVDNAICELKEEANDDIITVDFEYGFMNNNNNITVNFEYCFNNNNKITVDFKYCFNNNYNNNNNNNNITVDFEYNNKNNNNNVTVNFEYNNNINNNYFSNKNKYKIALVQVGCGKLCVLFRVCKWGFKMPQNLQNFLCQTNKTVLVQDPRYVYDNIVTQMTFKMSTKNYSDFIDYTQLLLSLGYPETGVGKSCENFWGVKQNKEIAVSNWEAENLTLEQINYAAQDIFITATTVRYLKYLHLSDQKCNKCELKLGECNFYDTMTKNYCGECHRGKKVTN